jgi:hypothetical protein
MLRLYNYDCEVAGLCCDDSEMCQNICEWCCDYMIMIVWYDRIMPIFVMIVSCECMIMVASLPDYDYGCEFAGLWLRVCRIMLRWYEYVGELCQNICEWCCDYMIMIVWYDRIMPIFVMIVSCECMNMIAKLPDYVTIVWICWRNVPEYLRVVLWLYDYDSVIW